MKHVSTKRYMVLFVFIAFLSVTITYFYVAISDRLDIEPIPFEWETISGDESYLERVQLSGSLQKSQDYASNSLLFETDGHTVDFGEPLSWLERYDAGYDPYYDRIAFEHRSLFRPLNDLNTYTDVNDENDQVTAISLKQDQQEMLITVLENNTGNSIQATVSLDGFHSEETGYISYAYVEGSTVSVIMETMTSTPNGERLLFYVIDLEKQAIVQEAALADLATDSVASDSAYVLIGLKQQPAVILNINGSLAFYDFKANRLSEIDTSNGQNKIDASEAEDGSVTLIEGTDKQVVYRFEADSPETLTPIGELPKELTESEDHYLVGFTEENGFLHLLVNETRPEENPIVSSYSFYTVKLEDGQILYHGKTEYGTGNGYLYFHKLKRA
ncbi:hypothetical protein [Shouchella clausii]|uniref:hypothetical protein n=1 Tax=Shouchella clausii TaxID=79880 RepID=UPI000B960B81|nr:hypothetical protein [Shouchella clausii]AST96666.1 hypothetical protein BC8716_12185 [Shouchella clausii]MCR1289369.1 hypothetical protein [Shouchella clausii]MEB5473609.1 hypothetical protein [Shouchella clausii]QNM43023.1 hypothetical protein DUT88_09045 [Shouchella clausii]WQG94115.1 hypothetical protein SR921_16390 [Shouchella clausii]